MLVPLFPESAPAIRELLEKYGSFQDLLPVDELFALLSSVFARLANCADLTSYLSLSVVGVD